MRKPMCHAAQERGEAVRAPWPSPAQRHFRAAREDRPGHSRYRMNREAEGRQAFCELGWYREVVYSVPEQGGSFLFYFSETSEVCLCISTTV